MEIIIIVVLLTELTEVMVFTANLLQNVDLTEEKRVIKIKFKKFNTIYKMDKEIITFGNIEVEKYKFHQLKNPILIFDVNIAIIIVSNKVPYGYKRF